MQVKNSSKKPVIKIVKIEKKPKLPKKKQLYFLFKSYIKCNHNIFLLYFVCFFILFIMPQLFQKIHYTLKDQVLF